MTYGAYPYGTFPYGAFPASARGLTIEERIEAALLAHVATLYLPGEPEVAWPNTVFTDMPADKPLTYIEVVHFRNRNERLFVKSTDPHLRQGILQLTAVTPLNGGPTPATMLAGEIARQCPADLALLKDGTLVRVQSAPDVMNVQRVGVSWNARVDIRYDCFE